VSTRSIDVLIKAMGAVAGGWRCLQAHRVDLYDRLFS
jgi:hypothetical protein